MMRPTTIRLSLLFAAVLFAASCSPQQSTPDDGESAMEDTETMDEASADTMTADLPAAIPPRADDPSRVSPNAMAEATMGSTDLIITYGSPGVKGRQIYGGLVPYEQVWRAGANEATVFYVSNDVTVNGEPLAAGAYGFFAIPGEDEWTLIFNTEAEQWGAFDYDASKDALRVTATPEQAPPQEQLQFTIETSDTAAIVGLHWDTVLVPFTVEVQ